MITMEDIRAFGVWLRGWIVLFVSLALLILLFAGLGRVAVRTDEMATTLGGMIQ